MTAYRVTETPGFLIAKLHQRSLALYRDMMAEYDLTPSQYGVIAALGGEDGLNQRQIGDILEVDRATLSGILERLERLEYVSRRPDTADRRAMIVTLTERGHELLRATWPIMIERNEYLLDMLEPDEKEQFTKFLKLLLPELTSSPEASTARL